MSRARIRNRLFLLAALWVLPLFSAQASQVVYKEARPMKKADEATYLKATGEPEKQTRFIYDPTGKTDPFKSFIAEEEEVEKGKKSKPKTYLETVDLSQLELIAIIVGPKGNWAMVRDSKGTGHVIQKGTDIGTNGGSVHKITDREVVIREEYKDFNGETKYQEVSKSIPRLR